jgi:predicted acyltransferase
MLQLPRRLVSIDIFRALTMFLMIFVNDLWSLKDIPDWLEHTKSFEDGMGLADSVFPAFLFIVGLSIPFAIRGRQAKGTSDTSTLIHILLRSFALLVMGIYHVNLESYSRTAALLPRPYWQILITLGFFLVWLDYPATMEKRKKQILQAIGVLLLIGLALIFKGGRPGKEGWMSPSWYGILGLIGWAYLICALIYLFSKDRLSILIGALVFFELFNIGSKAGWLHFLDPIQPYFWINSNGALPALTMGGIVVSVIYRQLVEKGKYAQCWAVLIGLALVMFACGFALRPNWGISKIRATPSWVMICTGISIAVFLLLIWLVDIKGKGNWFSIIKPAGTSTLTCYLLPYLHYALLNIFGAAISLPLFLRTGGIGIVKSMLYALTIILITGFLEKKKIRLKI